MSDQMTTTETVRELREKLGNLSADDATFARSLIAGFEKYGSATPKQAVWLDRMLAKANGQPDTQTAAVGDLASVYAMFETAKAHLKHPAIVLGYAAGELKISVAGERSRTPGALQVKDDATGTWFGRVHQNGTFEQSRRDPPPASVVDVLRTFAADPVATAAAHGHLTGKCCFCNRKLTDERSTAVGYGKTCADHFGQPWGAKAVKLPVGVKAVTWVPEAPAPVINDASWLPADDVPDDDGDADGYGWERRAMMAVEQGSW